MALTLNQVVARLKSLALSHRQINSVYFGDVPEFDANGDVNYPACFIEQTAGVLNDEEHLQRFGFRVYFVDRVGVSEDAEGNELEVLSDMTGVATDFKAMINYSGYQDDWEIDPASVVTPVTESLNDMVAGVYMDILIAVDYLVDRCQVPAEDVTFETDFDMARTRILTYTGTGAEGSAFEVSGLANKTVLAVYRAGSYKRAITTVPTDTDKIRVVGTDLGDRKGILSTTGYVGLSSGDALVNGEILDFIIWE